MRNIKYKILRIVKFLKHVITCEDMLYGNAILYDGVGPCGVVCKKCKFTMFGIVQKK